MSLRDVIEGVHRLPKMVTRSSTSQIKNFRHLVAYKSPQCFEFLPYLGVSDNKGNAYISLIYCSIPLKFCPNAHSVMAHFFVER